MSPKSRGRPHGRGRAKRRHEPDGPVRELRLSDRLIRAAHEVAGSRSAFDVDCWASGWLGQAWLDAGLSDRDPAHTLCTEVVGRACSHPSAAGLAAVAALRRVAPPSERALLDETITILAEHHPSPPWMDAPEPTPVAAWRAVDVWDSERILVVEFERSPRPHALLASINTVGGLMVEKLGLLDPGAQDHWARVRDPDDVPMPMVPAQVDDVLAELAEALQLTDITWPRQDDEDFVDLRAVAWARCRAYLPAQPDFETLTAAEEAATAERDQLHDAFLSRAAPSSVDADTLRWLTGLFLDYGQGYIHAGMLAWSPAHVAMFMTNWLPRKAVLYQDDRAALPAALRTWLEFALRHRGVDEQWIEPVVAMVDDCQEEFTNAFDDESSWGPAKQLAAELAARDIDLTDKDAVEEAIQVINAERLARSLLEDE